MGNVGKYGWIERAMVIEDVVKVRIKHRHVFFSIGCKFTVFHLHCNLNLLFMMNSRPTSKETDILPSNAWIQSHVVNFGADVGSPACFCDEHLVLDMFVETLKLSPHVVNNGGGEISGGAESMQKLVLFLWWPG